MKSKKRLLSIIFIILFAFLLVVCGNDGNDGEPGKDGVSITQVIINDQDELIITFSDGTTSNVGVVRGEDGTNGSNGLGVSSFSLNDEGELVVTYSDNTTKNLGKIIGANGNPGADGKEVSLQVANGYIQWKYDTDETWINLIELSSLVGAKGDTGNAGSDGTDGKEVLFQVSATHIQWQYVGDSTWKDLVALSTLVGAKGEQGNPGADGKEVSLQVANGYIQWKYDTDETWINLIELSSLVGAKGDTGNAGSDGTDGKEVLFQVSATHIQWQYVGDSTWKDLVALSTLVGAKGEQGNPGADGKEVSLQVANGYIQWKYDTDETWINLIELSSLVGAKGDTGNAGSDGTDGKEVLFQVSATHIQWQYVGDSTWKDLVALSTLTGLKGDTGNGISSIELTGTEGLVDTYTITYTNGTTATFTVTNGSDGQDGAQGIQGIQGEAGLDGHTPVITIGENGNWFIDGVDTLQQAQGLKGDTGNGISSIELTGTGGLVDTYTITYTNGTTATFTVTNGSDGQDGAQGIQGIQGEAGLDGHTPVITIGENGNWFIDGVDTLQQAQGLKGDTGNGISSIELTGTEGLVDTYTITYTNGTTATFTVTNGSDGQDGAQGIQGIQGEAGLDGHTPVITIGENGNWFIDGVDTLQQAQGLKGDTGNGISSIELTGTGGLVDTYTITYTNGTTATFTVTNGSDGQDGAQGIQGIQGEAGLDGHTPVITIGENGNWFIDGVDTLQQAQGLKGDTGNGISSIELTGTEGLVDTYTITYTNGTTATFTVTNGSDGQDGAQGIQGIQGEAGLDGHTPVITIGENGNWFIDGVDTLQQAQGLKGDTGNGISSIELTGTGGLVDTYTITYTNGTTATFTVTNGSDGQDGAQGIQGIQGEAGLDGHTPVITIGENGNWFIDGVDTLQQAQGLKGDTGNGISSIELTGTEGLVDTYTITYTNGTTATFTVTNGSDGQDGAQGIQGIQGEAGLDGHTPVITIGENGNWFIDGVDTLQQAQGLKGDTGNGISSIELTGTEGLVDTYTITYTNGTTATFTVTNGSDGQDGAQGIQGIQGEAGLDGHTPVITIGENGNWFIDGVDTLQQAQGLKGDTGNGISSIELTGTEGLVDTYTITYTNGTTATFTVTNGSDGQDGAQGIQGIQGEAGLDGHTPVITIGENGNWFIDGVDTLQQAQGLKGDTGNGISSIELTGTEGLVDTYTITYTNGTTATFTVTNGSDGQDGAQGIQGIQGEAGLDGHTPVITIGENGNWFIDGVDTLQQAQGLKGDTGNGISSIELTGTEGLVDTYTITYTNGTTATFTVTNGSDGKSAYQTYIENNPLYTKTESEWLEDLVNGRLATIEETKYTVTFNSDGGTLIDSQKVIKGEKAIEPTIPIKEGYTFVGWFMGEEKWSFIGYSVTEDITLVAKWIEDIDFNIEGATLESNVYHLSVDNNVTSINFKQIVQSNQIWYLSKDINGTSINITKVGLLEIGNNTFYIIEEDGNDYNTYEINIRRLPMFEYSTIDNMTYVYFGTYPQTVVDDSSLISSLNSLTSSNANGYYEFEGEEYAKVVADPYGTAYGTDYKFINGSTIQSGQTYYFKVEPIKWRVLEEADGTYTLLSEYIIDKQAFSSSGNRTIGDQTIYANNYEHSTIREWLNNDFYNKAFSSPEKGSILTTLVDNSASTTASSTNLYFSNNTMDKVYLLSYQEARSSTYGFSTSTSSSSTRTAVTTDYARAVGAYMDTSTSYYGNGYWWLRSPSNYNSINAHYVSYGGSIFSNDISYSYDSARPAIKIG